MKLIILLLLKVYSVLCYQTTSKSKKNKRWTIIKKTNRKKKYTKVYPKKLVLTANVVKSIKMKRERNRYVVIEKKNNNEKELLCGNRKK